MSKHLINSTRLTRDLQKVTSDLHQINSFTGLIRFIVLGFAFFSLVTIAWSTSNNFLFSGISNVSDICDFWIILPTKTELKKMLVAKRPKLVLCS